MLARKGFMAHSTLKPTLAYFDRPPSGRIMLVLLFVLVAVLILATVHFSVKQNAEQKLQQTADYHLSRVNSALKSTLSKHAYLPQLLAQNDQIKAFLTNPDSAAEPLNRYLERVNAIANTSDIYVMDPQGTTRLASNWHTNHSFIGKNFAFRPYFKQAIQQRLGRYFAVGTTSGERGYYFAYAIRDHESRLLGVMTVKVGISDFEDNWQHESFRFIVSDDDGVIFISNERSWRLHTLQSLDTQTRNNLATSRRYPVEQLKTLNVHWDKHTQGSWQTAIRNKHYQVTHNSMPTEGWHVYVLLDRASIARSVNLALGLSSLLLALTGLLFFTLWKNHQQRRDFERQAREELETKVEARTHELRRTQEELVQAAKMAALGQLAAGINHELNNPLSAIRAYADNALQFLDRDRSDMTRANLQEISSLTERMAAITRQLKTFSRKSQGNIVDCSLTTAIDSALLIAQQCLTQSNAHVETQLAIDAQCVRADLVWLEQILVNLISNAAEAVQGQEQRLITLNSERKEDVTLLHVHDSGNGIKDTDKPHLFEDFFTTKSVGKGLGLGLAISYRLAKDMQGELSADNHAQGGAVFTLTLPDSTSREG